MSNPYYYYGVNDLEDDAHHSSVMALLSQQSNVMFHKGIKKATIIVHLLLLHTLSLLMQKFLPHT